MPIGAEADPAEAVLEVEHVEDEAEQKDAGERRRDRTHAASEQRPADLNRDVSDKVRKLSIEAFRALGCEGLARIDFFLREDGKLVVNEVNTLPGFTNISMYPKVFEATGVSYSELVDRLIRHALARAGSGPKDAAP